MRRLSWAAFIVGAGALALYTYSAWGLKGSFILIAIWVCVYLSARLNRLRMHRRIRQLLANMPESQRSEALAALDESDRAEVIAAMQKEPDS